LRILFVRLMILISLIFFLFQSQQAVFAGTFEGNVKECYNQPSKCKVDAKKAAPSNKDSSLTSSPGITFVDVLKMIMALVFVIALIYFLLKFINNKGKSYQQNKLMHNLGGTSLGGNKSVQLVKIGERILVLGVGEDIRLLKEVDSQSEVENMVEYFESKQEQFGQSKDLFTNLWNKWRDKQKKVQKSQHESQSFQSVLKGQLDQMKHDRKRIMKEWEKKSDE
jgi:flagellar protein FliO/FliZ